jgi:S1-C subfamily serine protease
VHHFACCNCGKSLRAAPDVLGKRVKCPHCEKTFIVVGAEPHPTPLGGSDTRRADSVKWLPSTLRVAVGAAGVIAVLVVAVVMIVSASHQVTLPYDTSSHDSPKSAADSASAVPTSSALAVASSPASPQPTTASAAPSQRESLDATPTRAEEQGSVGPITHAADSVVLIHTDRQSLGTGFVVKNKSLIATNFHVIAGAGAAWVTFSDGTECAVDGFLAVSQGCDLAIIHLAKPAKVPPLEISSATLDAGVDVFAVGAPKGLGFSVSKGVVSAYRHWPEIERSFESDSGVDVDYPFDVDSLWVQTTTPISPGNSGGPLLSTTGKVVAVNTLRSTSETSQNINFSIHSKHLASLLAAMPKTVASLTKLPSPRALSLAPKKSAQKPGNAVDDVAAWNVAAEAMGSFMLDVHEIIFTLSPQSSRDQVRLAMRGLSTASLVAVEKVARIRPELLTPALASYVDELKDSLQKFHGHTRRLSRATHNGGYSAAQLEEVLDAPFEVLGIDSIATGERLNWLYQDEDDVYIGLPIMIQEHDIARAQELSQQWPDKLIGKITPVPPCPYGVDADLLWDTYWRSLDHDGGVTALQTLITLFPKSDDAERARNALRSRNASTVGRN